MKQRGRKSTAQLSVASISPVERPKPPRGLTTAQAREWREVVARLPADWIKREHYGVLENYCRHVTRARFLSKELDKLTEVGDVDRLNKLSMSAARETGAMLSCARSLRITHQSQYDTSKAARHTARSGARPWES